MGALKALSLQYMELNYLSVAEFAERCEVSVMAMRGYMNEKNGPNVYTALRISKVLNTTVERLWG